MNLNARYNKKRGFSLIEIVAAVLLFSVLTLILADMVMKTSRSYVRGRTQQSLRADVTKALSFMLSDINQAVKLPQSGVTTVFIPSAILVPNPYNAAYASNETAGGESQNRLVLIASIADPSKAITDTAKLGEVINDYNNMCFVEYIVPASPNQNTLLRRIYRVSTNSQGYNGYQVSGSEWRVIDSWLIASNSANNNNGDTLIKLGPSDKIEFWASRPDISYNGIYNIYHDPCLIELTVKMTKNLEGAAYTTLQQTVSYEESSYGRVNIKND